MTRAGLFRAWATVMAAILAAILLSMAAFTTGAGAQTPCSGKVVLDAGHGGTDSGAVNTKYDLTEKEQTLDVANRLKALLERDGCTVYMTRTLDSQTLSNNDRYTYANTTDANVLVSIHMNGSTNPSTDYTTTLFGKWRKDKELANTIFGSLSTLPPANGTGTIATRKPYSFASGVLLKSNMPATIAETVFITNNGEGELLSDETGARQQQIAQALRVGIEAYLTNH
ncbi:MAG TPA: N-acetylmuramoyl-L-alanine amidase [Rubrobacter sp.]|nr:N-acetylmuramoyl-L-alanine amidase [Rubrobacter sp.]